MKIMTLNEVTALLDKIVEESATLTSWKYLELFDDDFHVDIVTTRGIIKAHFLLNESFVHVFLKNDTNFVKAVGNETDLVNAINAMS